MLRRAYRQTVRQLPDSLQGRVPFAVSLDCVGGNAGAGAGAEVAFAWDISDDGRIHCRRFRIDHGLWRQSGSFSLDCRRTDEFLGLRQGPTTSAAWSAVGRRVGRRRCCTFQCRSSRGIPLDRGRRDDQLGDLPGGEIASWAFGVSPMAEPLLAKAVPPSAEKHFAGPPKPE